jgi:hypothetical protein
VDGRDRKRRVASTLGLLAASLVVALGVCELILRVGGFSFEVAPEGSSSATRTR